MCATNGRDGFPHLMPLWYVVRDGELWAWTFAKSQKVRNLERDPRATLQVEAGDRVRRAARRDAQVRRRDRARRPRSVADARAARSCALRGGADASNENVRRDGRQAGRQARRAAVRRARARDVGPPQARRRRVLSARYSTSPPKRSTRQSSPWRTISTSSLRSPSLPVSTRTRARRALDLHALGADLEHVGVVDRGAGPCRLALVAELARGRSRGCRCRCAPAPPARGGLQLLDDLGDVVLGAGEVLAGGLRAAAAHGGGGEHGEQGGERARHTARKISVAS